MAANQAMSVQSPQAPTLAQSTPALSNTAGPGLLPAFNLDGNIRGAPSAINTTVSVPASYYRAEPVNTDFLVAPVPLQPPSLLHSHSFPNGHQLPSQLAGLTPTTPLLPSPSFTASLGIAHVPIISSPLATRSMSRPSSPPRSYPIPDQPWSEAVAVDLPLIRTDSGVILRRQPSDARNDGRPVVNRSRSASNAKHGLMSKTAGPSVIVSGPSAPPAVWPSRQASPDDDEDEQSEDEGPRKLKRRRSSVGKDDGLDLSYATGPMISEDIRRQLDQIFEEFLNNVCSDGKSPIPLPYHC